MFKNKAKRYCIASGCKTSDKNSNRSFFSLPMQQKHAERRHKWLILLGREDLLGKSENKPTYFVCSAHFDKSAIKIVKHLKDTAIPTKCLANQPGPPSDAQEDTDDIEDIEDTDDDAPSTSTSTFKKSIEKVILPPNKKAKGNTQTQTNEQSSEQPTQPTKLVTKGTLRKRKVKKEKISAGHSWMKQEKIDKPISTQQEIQVSVKQENYIWINEEKP